MSPSSTTPLSSADTQPTEAPSSRSAGQRYAEATKRNGVGMAGGAGATLIIGVTMLAELLEKMGRIGSATGPQLTAVAVVAIVLLALYLQRQELRDIAQAAERERARNAYQTLIEKMMDRHREDSQDQLARLSSKVGTLVSQQAELVKRFDEAATRGGVLRFGGAGGPRG